MNTIIAIGAAHALYLSFLVFTKKKKGLPDYLLIVFLLLLAGVDSMVFFSFELEIPFFQIFLWNISLLLAPPFYLYASSLMEKKNRFRYSWLWHFLPYCISLVYLFYLIIVMPEPKIDELFVNQNLFSGPPLFTLFSILDLLAFPFYVIWMLILLRKHGQEITATFSRLEGRELKWLKILAIGILGSYLVINGFAFLGTTDEMLSDENSILYGFAASVFFIFYLGYFGVKQAAVFSGIDAHVPDTQVSDAFKESDTLTHHKKKYKKSSLKTTDADALSQKLLQYMEQEKPFLQNDLVIHDLARTLDISHHHLSQVVNESHRQSFFDFVNYYRVEEFKKRIDRGENKNFTLLAIALDCGFNSKSSFNRVFKKMTGRTPGQFVKSVK
ncbi:MAG: AraC family transcriptional regulator [Bacteroidetes bacterium]|nr:AraC family transcriptional regulator [Bacteroidota bacterium]